MARSAGGGVPAGNNLPALDPVLRHRQGVRRAPRCGHERPLDAEARGLPRARAPRTRLGPRAAGPRTLLMLGRPSGLAAVTAVLAALVPDCHHLAMACSCRACKQFLGESTGERRDSTPPRPRGAGNPEQSPLYWFSRRACPLNRSARRHQSGSPTPAMQNCAAPVLFMLTMAVDYL